jgi:hypothetical protein
VSVQHNKNPAEIKVTIGDHLFSLRKKMLPEYNWLQESRRGLIPATDAS